MVTMHGYYMATISPTVTIAQVMLQWISEVVHRSFLRRDVKLKADSLTVVEADALCGSRDESVMIQVVHSDG